MFNVLLYGLGIMASRIEEMIDLNRASIIAYIEDDEMKIGEMHNGKQIFSIDDAINLEYDYIVITSFGYKKITSKLLGRGVNVNKILPYYFNADKDLELQVFNNLYRKFEQTVINKDIEVISTGISYTQCAIKEQSLSRNAFNFALGNEDLYYNYKVFEHILNNYERLNQTLKYVIIGLSYYSFQYDLSKSSICKRVGRYYDVLGDMHNFNPIHYYVLDNYNDENVYVQMKIEDEIYSKIKKNILKVHVGREEEIFKLSDFAGKVSAEEDAHKDYPETVVENKKIFDDYLKLIKSKNIKPIIIVAPSSQYYCKHFPKTMKEDFYSIINEFKDKYYFQFLDYFDCNLFDDKDFWHVSHLNENGGQKFTEILEKNIVW